MENILKLNDVKIANIKYSEPAMDDNHNIVTKLWYDFGNDYNQSFFIKTPIMTIVDIYNDEITLKFDKQMNEFYENFDNSIINHLKISGLLKKHGLKNITYKTIISETVINNENIDVFKFNLADNIKVYHMSSKIVSKEQYKKMFVIGTTIKAIMEPDSCIVDVNNKYIYTNIKPCQILVTKVKETVPKKIELTDYCFTESDCENDDRAITTKFIFQSDIMNKNFTRSLDIKCTKVVDYELDYSEQSNTKDDYKTDNQNVFDNATHNEDDSVVSLSHDSESSNESDISIDVEEYMNAMRRGSIKNIK